MRIIVPTPDHARHIGKRFAAVLSVPLTRGYFVAARVMGYKSWDELLEFCSWSPGYFTSQAALPDSQCMPLALTIRQLYQAQTLAEVAGIELSLATEVVSTVRPSDGFRPPENPLGAAQRRHRLIDPKITPATHVRLSAELFGVWQVAGRQARISKALRELALLLEGLQLSEWPMNQFLYDLRETAYGGWSPTYMGDLRRGPRFLSEADLQNALRALDTVATAVARAEIVDLERQTERLADVVGQAVKHFQAWREKSAPHDGQPQRFDGVQPVEDEGVDVLRQHFRLTEHQANVLGDPEYDLDEARRLLESVQALTMLNSPVRDLKAVKWIATKLKRGISRGDRRLDAADAERQPRTRPWDVWCIGGGTCVKLGTFAASSSMRAIAAAPCAVMGRIIAVPSGLRPWRLPPTQTLEQPALELLS